MTYHITAHQQSSQQPLGPWVPALAVKVWPQTSDLGIRHAVPKLLSSASHVKTKKTGVYLVGGFNPSEK